jgi:hypothetical protein
MEALYKILVVGAFLNGLAAYNFFSVPLPWIGSTFLIVGLVIGLFSNQLSRPPYFSLALGLLVWALFVTLVNLPQNYEDLMPENATTAYPIYVFIRFVDLMVFISSVVLVYSLCNNGYKKRLIAFIVLLGTVLSIAAIYMYMAQLYGWWEPPRNRMGTGGQETGATFFSYTFHRATGTFREPSHLAEWLIVPFFLSMAYKRLVVNVHSVLMCSAALLTGSLNGVLAIAAGLTVMLVGNKPFEAQNAKNTALVAVLLLMGGAGFSAFAASYDETGFGLFETILERIEPMIQMGTGGTNRDYVYDYLWSNPPPLFGYGLGNGNLVFTDGLGASAVTSFLNIFVNALYNLGVPGLIITTAIILAPVGGMLRIGSLRQTDLRLFVGAYIALLVFFLGHTETFNMSFGLFYGLIVSLIAHENVTSRFLNSIEFNLRRG